MGGLLQWCKCFVRSYNKLLEIVKEQQIRRLENVKARQLSLCFTIFALKVHQDSNNTNKFLIETLLYFYNRKHCFVQYCYRIQTVTPTVFPQVYKNKKSVSILTLTIFMVSKQYNRTSRNGDNNKNNNNRRYGALEFKQA